MISRGLKPLLSSFLAVSLLLGVPGQGFYAVLAAERAPLAESQSSSRSLGARAGRPELQGREDAPLDETQSDDSPRNENLPIDAELEAALLEAQPQTVATVAASLRDAARLSRTGIDRSYIKESAAPNSRRSSFGDLDAAARLGFEAPLDEISALPRIGGGLVATTDPLREGVPNASILTDLTGPHPNGLRAGMPLSRFAGEGKRNATAVTTYPSPFAEGTWHKSAGFPAVLAGALAFVAFVVWAVREATAWYAFQALDAGTAAGVAPILGVFDVTSLAGLSLAFAAVVWGARELLLVRKLAREAPRVSDEDFYRAAHEAVDRLKLPPQLRTRFEELVKPYRGQVPLGYSFGFSTRGGIYAQPALALHPGLLYRFLKHEADHYLRDQVWAPYRSQGGWIARSWRYFWRELRASAFEVLPEAVQRRWLPNFEFVLRKARYSLDLPGRYRLLLLEPTARRDDWGSPAVIDALSVGKAMVIRKDPGPTGENGTGQIASILTGGDPHREDRFRVIVASGDRFSPPKTSTLKVALDQLERVRQTAVRLREGESVDTDIAREIRRRVQRGVSHETAVEEISTELWHEQFERKLSDVELVKALEGIYGRLQDRGPAILHWDQPNPDIESVAKLFQFWRGEDGGKFEVVRVKMEDGGEAIVAIKNEPRIDIWLHAAPGRQLDWTKTRLQLGDQPDAAARSALTDAGYNDRQIARFIDEMDIEVKHVFGGRFTERGPPTGMNYIFATVPRRYREALKRFAETDGFSVRASGRYKAHMTQSIPIQKINFLQRFLGIKGKGVRLDSSDTGVDDTHPDFAMKEDKISAKSYTNDPATVDTGEHGTFTFSEILGMRGAAPEASGVMRRVFPREGGASDGDIMASLVDAYQDGTDGHNLSLGQDGEVGSDLAVFVSKLVSDQKNSHGEPMAIVVSFGNSGPVDMAGGDPATGEHAFAVAAATKSLDDGVPEVAWYSSRGFAIDSRWYVPRLVFKPEITAVGGDVTPGEDMFRFGVQAAKSKFGEPSASDTPKHDDTRMSGTSMAAPFVTAVYGLLKQAVRGVFKLERKALQAALDDLPFSLKMILMRSAQDMKAPLVAQGPGLMNALAALLLAANTFGGAKDVSRIRKLALKAGVPAEEMTVADRLSAGEGGMGWIQRLRELSQKEMGVYHAAKEAGDAVKPTAEKANAKPSKAETQKAALQRFNAERDKVLPDFVNALQDPVWLVRMYAAFYLINFASPAAAEALLKTALNDEDARVRQAAFFALAAASDANVDDRLAAIAASAKDEQGRPYPVDVPIYAAYALLRRAPASMKSGSAANMESVFRPVVQGLADSDKTVRETATWVAGQLGKQIPASAAEAVARRVSDPNERNNIRHVAAIAVAKIAFASKEGTVTDETILHMLRGSQEDQVLAMDAYSFFSVAAKKTDIADRMRSERLSAALQAFVERFKSEPADSPQGKIARLLASILGIKVELNLSAWSESKSFSRFGWDWRFWDPQ